MDIFLIIVCILFVVALLDLVVGVSNDAVNFLNSAIGSKVASFKVILIIATVGILLGSVFSSGIMEVARKGVFNPQFFTFEMVMFLFLAVMLTDIILLDFFNSIGLPTSTTVSIVFELLGAAFMIGLFMTVQEGEVISEVVKYINLKNALVIISGIFLSILFAFSFGAIGQYLSRLMFTFNYEKNIKKYGAFFGAIAITSITYFLLIKGLKGSPLKDYEFYIWLKEHTLQTIGLIFVIWFFILQFVVLFSKVNPLKIVVLVGTFSLAMAFAGNDLVNFIGVPIAAFAAFNHWKSLGSPEGLKMEFLANDVHVDTWMLLVAGVVMCLTLWFSTKARKVTETEVNLGRQDEGDERFESNKAARAIVRTALGIGKISKVLVPSRLYNRMNAQFQQKQFEKAVEVQDNPAFDLVRASVNLMMASIIIAYATSKKMPLSTTYVSFMVAMGTSLADRAWGRESAVYRVAGVLSVIGGWLMTAIIAFSAAAIFAFIIAQFQLVGIIAVVLLAVYALVSSQITFSKKQKEEHEMSSQFPVSKDVEELLQNSRQLTLTSLQGIKNSYSLSLRALPRENKEMLLLADNEMNALIKKSYKVRNQAIKSIKKLESDDLNVGKLYLLSGDLIQDITQSNKYITEESLYYVKNLHKSVNVEYASILEQLEEDIRGFIEVIITHLEELNFSDLEEVKMQRNRIRAFINQQLDTQVESIQIDNISTKRAILQTELLLQSRDILAVSYRLYKLYKNYIENYEVSTDEEVNKDRLE